MSTSQTVTVYVQLKVKGLPVRKGSGPRDVQEEVWEALDATLDEGVLQDALNARGRLLVTSALAVSECQIVREHVPFTVEVLPAKKTKKGAKR